MAKIAWNKRFSILYIGYIGLKRNFVGNEEAYIRKMYRKSLAKSLPYHLLIVNQLSNHLHIICQSQITCQKPNSVPSTNTIPMLHLFLVMKIYIEKSRCSSNSKILKF